MKATVDGKIVAKERSLLIFQWEIRLRRLEEFYLRFKVGELREVEKRFESFEKLEKNFEISNS
jgi:hypothetical protein